jgi:hypothetical protein
MWIILGFCVLGALAVGYLRHRANGEPKELRGRYSDRDEKGKS